MHSVVNYARTVFKVGVATTIIFNNLKGLRKDLKLRSKTGNLNIEKEYKI